jgi:hypothetical protein
VPLSATRAGRRLLSAAAVVLVGAMLLSNLPSSVTPEPLASIEQPVTDLTGLSQNWALFAPTPRSRTLQLRAELERADGTVETWRPPVGDRAVGVYRTYRWRKWAGYVVSPDRGALHDGAASHLLQTRGPYGSAPVTEIRLYRDVHEPPPPGSGVPLDRDPTYESELLDTFHPEDGEL